MTRRNLEASLPMLKMAVAFFKENAHDEWHVSMRSKGAVDINAVANQFGGGGHKNASGCTANGRLNDLKALFRQKITEQIDKAVDRRQ